MTTLFLKPFNPDFDQNIIVELTKQDFGLSIKYQYFGDISQLKIAPLADHSIIEDNLWKTTCFELFIKYFNGSYHEFNFSTSLNWNQFFFTDYRNKTEQTNYLNNRRYIDINNNTLNLTVEIDLPSKMISSITKLNISTILEYQSNHKEYFAITHPESIPNFHHPESFNLYFNEI